MHELHQGRSIHPLLKGYYDLLKHIESFNCVNVQTVFEPIVKELSEDDQQIHHQLIGEITKINEKLHDLYWISEH